jgi:hypothetical protein
VISNSSKHCGKEVYADFNSTRPHEIQDFFSKAPRNTEAVNDQRTYPEGNVESLSTSGSSPPSHLGQSSTLNPQPNILPTGSGPLLPTEEINLRSRSDTIPSNGRFLLLCVKGRKQRTHLRNVDLSKVTNDPLLFKEAKTHYRELRDGFPLYIPISIKYIKVTPCPTRNINVLTHD